VILNVRDELRLWLEPKEERMNARAAFIGIGFSIALLVVVALGVEAMMPTVLRALFMDNYGAIILGLVTVVIAVPFVYRRIRDYGFFNPTSERKR
jgi:hypothetical protein